MTGGVSRPAMLRALAAHAEADAARADREEVEEIIRQVNAFGRATITVGPTTGPRVRALVGGKGV